MAATFKTEAAVYRAVRKRFKAPEYAVLPGVRNGTGYSRVTREIDAMMMSLWPSRGLLLHGIEIKVSRSDWLRELRNPNKQEAIFKYCDRFWLAVGDASIVHDGELPETWGLLVPRGQGIVIKKQAPERQGDALDRSFLAAILRRVDEVKMDPSLEREIREELHKEYSDRLDEGRKHMEEALEAKGRVSELEGKLALALRFEERSGMQFHRYRQRDLDAAAGVVKALRHASGAVDPDNAVKRLRHIESEVQRLLTETTGAIAAMETYNAETAEE